MGGAPVRTRAKAIGPARHGLRFEMPRFPLWHSPRTTTFTLFVGPAAGIGETLSRFASDDAAAAGLPSVDFLVLRDRVEQANGDPPLHERGRRP
jgi:hypothetical protein